MYVFQTITPILLIIATGYVLKETRFLPPAFFQQINKLVFYVALPCLLFYKTAQPSPDMKGAFQTFMVLLIGMMLCIIAAYLVAWIQGLQKQSIGAFVQGAYRSNLAYVGLPVVLFAIAGSKGAVSAETEALAVLVLIPLIPIYNIAAVIVLLSGNPTGTGSIRTNLLAILKATVKNPLIISMVAGVLYSQSGVALPVVVERTCSPLGQVALPLSLVGIGASLTFKDISANFFNSLLAALIKTVAAPVFGFIAGKMLNISNHEMLVVLLYLACPTAVASYVMAEQMKADHKLSINIIILSVLLSFAGFTVILSLF